MRIAISGAGIAGTALAFWLSRLGHEVLLVERAPSLRTGGYVINLWGLGYDALERMGLLPALLARQHPSGELRLVDRAGRTTGGYSSDVLARLAKGRIATLARSDIAAAIHGALDARVETLFGDGIATIDDDGRRVRLGFEQAAPREVDLLIGADGLRSQVRQQVFGPDAAFEHPLGCHVASFEAVGYPHRNGIDYLAHSAPGRYVSRFAMRDGRMVFVALMRDEYLPGRFPVTLAERRSALARAFEGMGWETAAIVAAAGEASEIYFDRVSQIRMTSWSSGRVVLAGDAAHCPSLIAGEGAGFALAGAYVLAGELHRHGADRAAAIARYQSLLQPVVRRKQSLAVGLVESFVPRSSLGVRLRDAASRLMRLPVFPGLLMGRYFRDALALPDYGI